MTRYRPRDAVRHISSGALIAVVALVLALIAGSMYVFGWGFFQRETADFRGETSKREKVEGSGDYRIAAYDHFHDLCAQVQTAERSIKNLERELKAKPKPSNERILQINASITALRNSRAENVNQYNADASKDYTAGQFRDSDLPYKLDIDAKETTCTSNLPSPEST